MITMGKETIKREILIYDEAVDDCRRIRCVLLENSKPVELLEQRLDNTDDAADKAFTWFEQDIILARISRVVPSLSSAFVDIGQQSEGMLPLRLAPPGVKAGQLIVVQVLRLTQEGKGCQLTALPQLPGFFIVLRPYENRHLKRSRLRSIDRAKAQEMYQDELVSLTSEWEEICAEARLGGETPRLLRRFQQPVQKALRDWLDSECEYISVDGLEHFKLVDSILKQHVPFLLNKLRLISSQQGSIPDIYRLSDLDRQIYSREIWLKNGGKIVFDQTEALLAIDVNSAKADKQRDPQKLWLKTNLHAAWEICRLLRLRRIQGIIIIDFIRLKHDQDVEEIDKFMRELLARDKARIQIGGFSRLGLYELTRSLKK